MGEVCGLLDNAAPAATQYPMAPPYQQGSLERSASARREAEPVPVPPATKEPGRPVVERGSMGEDDLRTPLNVIDAVTVLRELLAVRPATVTPP